jgi:hypothetical protein
VTTAQLLSAIATVLGGVAFAVITYIDRLNNRDADALRDFEAYIARQELSVDDPIEPLENPSTAEQRELAETIDLITVAEQEALKTNKTELLNEADRLRERQARRRRLVVAGQLATAGTFVLGLAAAFA